ncbi:protein turtle-like isoform X2 [Centruroides vittatus]|uniref:protein turtle-like isoform X2 n=1 Tax=Centruroides vittatus TaxID=120091 RepID=UPI00350E9E9A
MWSDRVSCWFSTIVFSFIAHPRGLFSTVPPREAIIMDEFGQHLHGIIGPYNEGYPLSLICEGEGGDPPPKVTWWKDSILIDDTYTLTPQHFTRNELHFSTIRRSDLMTVLTCQATNSNFTAPVTSSVTLDLNLRPLDVRIHTAYRPVSVGQEVELVCQSQGARPPAQISWWKGTEKLTQVRETTIREDNLTISVLTYVPTISDNGRNLSCRADNPQLRDSEIEDVWFLDVYYPPQLTLSNNLWKDMEAVTEKSDVTLICHIQANPPISEVSWRFNGKSLFSSPSLGVVIKNHTLLLSPVEKEHQGYYQCRAENVEGKGNSQDLFLKVHYAPKCMSPRHSVYGVIRSEAVSVTCDVDADPTEVTFKWALNRSAQDIQPIDSFKSNGTRSIATIIPEDNLGFGILLCWASNSVGLQKEPCSFQIIPAGPPEEPKHCILANRTIQCLVVQCEAGNDGGLTQLFHLEIFVTESHHLQANVSISDVPVFTICNLPTQTSFLLVIYSANAKGRSKSVALRSSTLSQQSTAGEEDTLSINHVVGILIGAVSVLLLATFVAITVGKLRTHRRRKGRTYRGDLEKSQTHLMKECKDSRLTGSQGPDIIPEKNYFQERSEITTRDSISDADASPKMTKGEPPPAKYDKYQTIQYGEEPEIVLSTPRKLRMLQETEGEMEECGITVETPLINDVQLGVTHWGDAYKEVGVLSTPV